MRCRSAGARSALGLSGAIDVIVGRWGRLSGVVVVIVGRWGRDTTERALDDAVGPVSLDQSCPWDACCRREAALDLR
jgi:hypothetical protein